MKPFNLGAPCGYAYTGLVERLGLPEELRQNLSLFIIIRKKKEKNVGEESEGLESNPTKKASFQLSRGSTFNTSTLVSPTHTSTLVVSLLSNLQEKLDGILEPKRKFCSQKQTRPPTKPIPLLFFECFSLLHTSQIEKSAAFLLPFNLLSMHGRQNFLPVIFSVLVLFWLLWILIAGVVPKSDNKNKSRIHSWTAHLE